MIHGKEVSGVPALIWVIGESVLMDGVLTSLSREASVKLEQMTFSETELAIARALPDLVIFELGPMWMDRIYRLIQTCAHVRLIGLELISQQVFVLESKTFAVHSMDQLAEVVWGFIDQVGNIPKGGE